MTVSTDSNGTTLSHTAYATYFADDPNNTGLYDWSTPFIVEVDILSYTNADIQIYDGSHNATRTISELGLTTDNHLKIVNDGTSVKYFVDGVEKTAAQFNLGLGTARVGFRTTSSGGNLKYKNFVIYPV